MLTSLVFVTILISIIPHLRNGWGIFHGLLLLSATWFAQKYYPVQDFSENAILATVTLHLILINITTFLAYFYDKQASINGKWRVSEATLHALSLIGGIISAYFSSKLLHHKNIKKSFRIKFWLIFIAQIGALTTLYLFIFF